MNDQAYTLALDIFSIDYAEKYHWLLTRAFSSEERQWQSDLYQQCGHLDSSEAQLYTFALFILTGFLHS